MTKKEKMLALRATPDIHYNCAQSVLMPFAEELGITEEQARDLTQNFGSGMGCGSMCGALVGAMMAMGGLGLPLEKRTEITRWFRERNGALDCPVLLKAAMEQGLSRKDHCDDKVESCLAYVCREAGIE